MLHPLAPDPHINLHAPHPSIEPQPRKKNRTRIDSDWPGPRWRFRHGEGAASGAFPALYLTPRHIITLAIDVRSAIITASQNAPTTPYHGAAPRWSNARSLGRAQPRLGTLAFVLRTYGQEGSLKKRLERCRRRCAFATHLHITGQHL